MGVNGAWVGARTADVEAVDATHVRLEGLAATPKRKPGLGVRFRPSTRNLEADVAAAIADGTGLLHLVDRHFRDGVRDDRLKPWE